MPNDLERPFAGDSTPFQLINPTDDLSINDLFFRLILPERATTGSASLIGGLIKPKTIRQPALGFIRWRKPHN